MSTTSIRVTTSVRDKLSELSRAEGKSAGQLIEKLVNDYEKREFFRKLGEDFRRLQSDPEAWAEYQRELAEWDAVLMDGLEDEPQWEERLPRR